MTFTTTKISEALRQAHNLHKLLVEKFCNVGFITKDWKKHCTFFFSVAPIPFQLLFSSSSLFLNCDQVHCDFISQSISILSLSLSLYHVTVQHTGSITFDDVLNIARTMRPRSIAKEMSGTVKEILGTAQSVGCKVDGRHPHDVIDDINDGTIVVEVRMCVPRYIVQWGGGGGVYC